MLQHWPAKADQDTLEMRAQRVDSYMACMTGRVAISAFADYSDKGMDAAIQYAKKECRYIDAILGEMNEETQKEIARQIVIIWKAVQAGMVQQRVNAENNAEALGNGDLEHSAIRGLIMARKHYLDTFVRM